MPLAYQLLIGETPGIDVSPIEFAIETCRNPDINISAPFWKDKRNGDRRGQMKRFRRHILIFAPRKFRFSNKFLVEYPEPKNCKIKKSKFKLSFIFLQYTWKADGKVYIEIKNNQSSLRRSGHQSDHFFLGRDFSLPLQIQQGIPVAVTMQVISSLSYSSQSRSSICSHLAEDTYWIKDYSSPSTYYFCVLSDCAQR